MPRDIDRDEVVALREAGAQLVEVLPADEFKETHLPGAIGIPLPKIDEEAPGTLDATKTVIVYCWDTA